MIFRPAKSKALWDTWLFPWEDGYHLFFLETQPPRRGVGHAFSRDLVHWEVLPSIKTWGASGEWNGRPLVLTGTVVPHEGTFYMFAGSNHRDVQVVGVYTSQDLEHWTPHPANPVMRPTGPHYLAQPVPPFFYSTVDWRDPCRHDWVRYLRGSGTRPPGQFPHGAEARADLSSETVPPRRASGSLSGRAMDVQPRAGHASGWRVGALCGGRAGDV